MSKLVTLKKNKEFNFVYRKGKPLYSKDLTMVFVKSKYGGVRVGFSVSKKVGNAVKRNLYRRRLKEAFIKLDTKGNFSIIFIPKPSVEAADFTSICYQVNKLLANAHIV